MSKAEYLFVRTDQELRTIATEMRTFAEQNPLNKHQVESLIINEPGEREQHGPLTRIHGKEAGVLAKKYSRFICFSTKDLRPLQVTYLVYSSAQGAVRQLTVTNNIKENLCVGDLSRIAFFFINPKLPVHSLETPPHVALMIQMEDDNVQS